MADVTVLHNPRCTKSCAALTAAEEAGVDVDVVRYLDEPLDADAVRALLAKLEDAPAALVRRADAKGAGVVLGDLDDPDYVADLLAAHPALMERPVLIRGDRAVIGRPTERAEAFLRG